MPKDGDANTTISVDHGNKIVLMPKAMYSDDENLITVMICKLALDLKYDLTLYESDKYQYDQPTMETRQFLTGMVIGTDDTINLKINGRSDIVELGRVCSYAIRVRGHFRNTNSLGLGALRKNQKFFSNDPQVDAKTRSLKESSMIDYHLSNYLSDKKEVPEIRKVITSLLEKCALMGLPDDHRAAAEKQNLVTFNEIQDHYRRKPLGAMKPRKKDSKKSEMGKLPEKPSTSPLMTKVELEKYSDMTGPIWQSLDMLSKTYYSRVKLDTFDRVRDRIASTFNVRWELLTAYSSVTTKRLREVRAILKDSRLAKSRVTESDLTAMLKNRTNKDLKWVLEQSELIKPLSRVEDIAHRKSLLNSEPFWKKIDAAIELKDMSLLEKARKEQSANEAGLDPDDPDYELIKYGFDPVKITEWLTKEKEKFHKFELGATFVPKSVTIHEDDFMKAVTEYNEIVEESARAPLASFKTRMADARLHNPATSIAKWVKKHFDDLSNEFYVTENRNRVIGDNNQVLFLTRNSILLGSTE
jgi:hypothetical protein